jgi:hypothetical protein|tara:strand:+ start:4176 stop:4409 length:234 start_codon:yes stop_codon:yes gene_type:complete
MTKLNEKKLKESYNSSNLKSSTYDVETKELIVEFKKGGKYSYSDVPLQTVVSLRRAPSKGTYFNQSIAKIYKYKKIS